MIYLILSAFLAVTAPPAYDETGVRAAVEKWNDAYTHLDAKALAATTTPDFQLVDRFGHWFQFNSREEVERLFAWTFKEVYKGRPKAPRKIERVRFLTPDSAVVYGRAFHSTPTILDDGTRIPPFWELNTFTLVKHDGQWLICAQNIHNQIGPEMEGPGSKLDPSVVPARK